MAALYLCVNNPKGSGCCRGVEGKAVYLSIHDSAQARKTTHVVTSGFKIYFHLYCNESIVNAAFIVILCHVFKRHILSKVTCERFVLKYLRCYYAHISYMSSFMVIRSQFTIILFVFLTENHIPLAVFNPFLLF